MPLEDSCGCEEVDTPRAPSPGAPEERSFRIGGMDCAEEVATLRKAIGPLVGGPDRLGFDVLNARMSVAATPQEVPDDAIIRAVRATGMTATAWTASRAPGEERQRRRSEMFTAASGALVLLGMALHVLSAADLTSALRLFVEHAAEPTPWPEIAAYLGAILLGGRYVAPKALYAARRLRPDMNLLMVIAVAGAAGIGEWFEAATVAFLFSLSLTLESWSVGRARRAVAALLDLAPPSVRLLRPDGSERTVPVAEVRPGDHFVVAGGDRIALDGEVVAGASSVDQAPITGESIPVQKTAGAPVFAGSINGDGALTVRATRAAADTTLAHIIQMVEQAHARRAPSEQWVERFARVYTPAVMAMALAVFLVPPLLFGGDWTDWFYRALVLLVIACPCALVISTPVSIVAALASAARSGVLVKGGAFIELPARLRAIAMDKTGTITRGAPEVVRIIPLAGHTEAELLARAAALEARSSHPLARAIVEHARTLGVPPQAAEDVQVQPGKGLSGRFDGRDFWLGSHRFLVERGQDDAGLSETVLALEAEGKTVILVGNGRHVCGLIAVADTVRPQAAEVIAELHALGVTPIVMLTGDNRATAEAIGRSVGVDQIEAELLPDDKLARIEALVGQHGTVAMVGDGVNDAPALARATLGIAMGAIGSDAAIETADVALMTDDLARLPWLIRHSRRTLAVIRQNVAFSLGVKAIFLALTLAGIASLWGAIAADVGASLLVVFNALRLLRARSSSSGPPTRTRL